jgi:hypothetical protein
MPSRYLTSWAIQILRTKLHREFSSSSCTVISERPHPTDRHAPCYAAATSSNGLMLLSIEIESFAARGFRVGKRDIVGRS